MKNITPDSWNEEKALISQFYASCFNLKIDWSKVELPAHNWLYPYLEYVPYELTYRKCLETNEEIFAKNPQTQDLDGIIDHQQSRPKKDYAFAWKGISKSVRICHDRGYYDFCDDGNHYMIPKEALLAVLRKRFEGEIFKVMICLHARDYTDHILYLSWDKKIDIYFGDAACAKNQYQIKL